MSARIATTIGKGKVVAPAAGAAALGGHVLEGWFAGLKAIAASLAGPAAAVAIVGGTAAIVVNATWIKPVELEATAVAGAVEAMWSDKLATPGQPGVFRRSMLEGSQALSHTFKDGSNRIVASVLRTPLADCAEVGGASTPGSWRGRLCPARIVHSAADGSRAVAVDALACLAADGDADMKTTATFDQGAHTLTFKATRAGVEEPACEQVVHLPHLR